MKLPNPIKVGGFVYKVIYDEAMYFREDDYGDCHNASLTIRIASGMPDTTTVNTVIHEVGHAIWYVYGLEDEDKEEKIVNTMANGWHQVFVDNMHLLNFIKRGITNGADESST